MPAEVEAIAYNYERGVPWHGIGTRVDGLMTAEEAIEKGGLNWEVIPTPIQTAAGFVIPDKVANMRSTDGAYLGTVGDGYVDVANARAFSFANALVAENPGKALYDTTGSLRGGRHVFLSMDLTQVAPIRVNGDPSDFHTFLLLANSHDGSMALRGTITPVRVVCENTLNAAIYGATPTFAIRHSGDIEHKLAAAREALGLTIDYLRRFEEVADAAQKVKVSDERAERILQQAFGMRKVTREKPESDRFANHPATKTFELYQTVDNLASFRGTAWGLVNATAQFVDHDRFLGKDMSEAALDNRATSLLWGSGQQTVTRVLALAAPKLAHPKETVRANARVAQYI